MAFRRPRTSRPEADLPSHRKAGCHPFAGLDRVNDGQLTGLELAATDHLVEMEQRCGAAAVADRVAAESELVSSDAETIEKCRDVIFVELNRRDRKNVMVDRTRIYLKLLGEFAQAFQQQGGGVAVNRRKIMPYVVRSMV